MVFAPKNFLGVPQADAKATLTYPVAQNRGTENNMTVFDGRTVRAVDVVAPGQSGFVAPDGALPRPRPARPVHGLRQQAGVVHGRRGP